MAIKKAGCILIDVINKKIGLVYRKEQDDYSFAKGHIDNGETLEECAVRETEEETGRKCRIVEPKNLPLVTYVNSTDGKVEVHNFIAIDEGASSQVFAPELVHELVWVSVEEAENILSYDNQKDLLRAVKSIINELFKLT